VRPPTAIRRLDEPNRQSAKTKQSLTLKPWLAPGLLVCAGTIVAIFSQMQALRINQSIVGRRRNRTPLPAAHRNAGRLSVNEYQMNEIDIKSIT
jgi:hypothetical protein